MRAGEEGARLSQMAPAWQEKSASHRQAGEGVRSQLQLFRESPGGQFCCRYDSAESLTCEVKVLVLEALTPGAAMKDALWRRKKKVFQDLPHRAGFSPPSTFTRCREEKAQHSSSQGVRLPSNTPGNKAPLTGFQTLGASESRGFLGRHHLALSE